MLLRRTESRERFFLLYEDTTDSSGGLSALLACEVMVGEVVEYIVGGTRPKLKAFPQQESALDEAPNHGYIHHRGESRRLRSNWTEQIAVEDMPINEW